MSNTNTITPGTYTARATQWHWDTTKDGEMCLKLKFQTKSEPPHEVNGTLYFNTDKADQKGRTAADRSMEALRSMGLRGDLDTVTAEGGGGLSQGDVSIVVEINDRGFAFAKYINPVASFTPFAPPSQDAKRAFFAQMKARTAGATQAARAAGTTPRAQSAAPKGPPIGFAQAGDDDDNIPF